MDCPYCNSFVDINHKNTYGHLCPYCYRSIPPDKEPEFVRQNKAKLNFWRSVVRQMLCEQIKGSKQQ